MDDHALAAAFRAHTEGRATFTRRMAIAIADIAGETPRGVVLRLEHMTLLKPGFWDWFVANGGITPEQIREGRAALSRPADGAA